ncbi:MAG TPA: AmmeMemoRadiSam system protein B, partial [Euryarchaeota archaeon]|nr:AmmeMemoRadiSam system protein B [Euryarchaeota archaeon]
MRYPAVAGTFYPGEKTILEKTIEECFLNNKFGPGELPKRGNIKLLGALVPHAGYVYSGPIAAHSYKAIAEAGGFESYVIIGTNHTGYGVPISISPEDWITPLGKVPFDKELAELIVKKSGVAEFDRYAHFAEHSVEVQLPFIQYVHKKLGLGEFRIVAISIGIHHDLELMKALAKGIFKAINELNRNAIIIASSDLNHAGRYYGVYAKGLTAREYGERLDNLAIEAILSLDTQKFLKIVEENQMSVCGVGA